MNRKLTTLLAFLMIAVVSVTAFAGGGGIVIPKGTLIKIRLDQNLSTKTSKTGDMVTFSVVDPLRIGKTVVIKRGAFAQAQLERVRSPGRFGRNGSLKIKYLFVTGANKKNIPITIGAKSAKTNESLGYATGASVAGYMILGPVGLFGSALVKGKHIDIPAGTVLMVETPGDIRY